METTTSMQTALANVFALVLATVGACATALFCSFALDAYRTGGKFWEFAFAFHLACAGVAALWTLLQALLLFATTGTRSPGGALLLGIGLMGVGPLCLAVFLVLRGVVWPPMVLVGSLVLAVITLVQLASLPEARRRQRR